MNWRFIHDSRKCIFRNLISALLPVYLIRFSHLAMDTDNSIHRLHFYLAHHICTLLNFSISVYTRRSPPPVRFTIRAMSEPSGAFTLATMAA